MAKRDVSPGLKSALELGPTILFVAGYLLIRDETFTVAGTDYDGFVVAAAAFVPVLLASMGALWALTGTISRMQVFTAVMVIGFGGLTVWFNDERFFKLKTTIVYGLIAGLLAIGLAMGRSFLEWVMGEMVPMRREGWMRLTRRAVLTFGLLAVANEIVWRTMSTEAWVAIETFAFPLILVASLGQMMSTLQPYLIEPEDEEPRA